ncbi:MAG: sulfatase-like hydrolase/transferase, partial [bacterium]|nr:sulfatase-like hydrolase/transferase [bacterium]
ENFGMLMKTLEDLGISDNTIVIFMTDNGPQQQRYNAGMRGRKGTVYEGGIRVPFYIRWPQRLQAGESVATPAAHIDVAPTLLAACGIEKPDSVHFDGRNLLPLIEESSPDWPDRYLFFQWHRGDKPERFRDCAVRGPRYKLVNGKELYDLKDDPAESTDIAAKHPDIVAEMRKAYLDWFRDVSGERGYEPPLIHLGDPREKVARLTPQDWRGPDAGWSRDDVGYWEVEVMREGNYSAKLIFDEAPDDGYAIFKLRTVLKETPIQKGQTELTLKNVDLPKGQGRLEAWLRYGKQASGMNYVEVWKE